MDNTITMNDVYMHAIQNIWLLISDEQKFLKAYPTNKYSQIRIKKLKAKEIQIRIMRKNSLNEICA